MTQSAHHRLARARRGSKLRLEPKLFRTAKATHFVWARGEGVLRRAQMAVRRRAHIRSAGPSAGTGLGQLAVLKHRVSRTPNDPKLFDPGRRRPVFDPFALGSVSVGAVLRADLDRYRRNKPTAEAAQRPHLTSSASNNSLSRHRPDARKPSQLVHAGNAALAAMHRVRGLGGCCDSRRVVQLRDAARKGLPTSTLPLLEVMSEPQLALEVKSARLAC
jgi:hypothetical protein